MIRGVFDHAIVLRAAAAIVVLWCGGSGPVQAADAITSFTIAGACKASSTCSAAVGTCEPEKKVELERGDRLVLCVERQEGFASVGRERVSLIINGQSLPKRNPVFLRAAATKEGRDIIEFSIPNNADPGWQLILRSGVVAPAYESVQVGVALNGQPASLAKTDSTINLVAYSSTLYGWAIAGLVVLFLALLYLAHASNTLRDRGFPPPRPSDKPPYSLARCQAAFWFLIVFASYVLLFVITGTYLNVLNDTALIVMGISTGTALGAGMIDANSLADADKATVAPLLLQEATLMTAIDDATAQRETKCASLEISKAARMTAEQQIEQLRITRLADAQSRLGKDQAAAADLAAANQQLADLHQNLQAATDNGELARKVIADLTASLDGNKKALAEVQRLIGEAAPRIGSRVTEGLITDLLTDKTGVSFHRFQMLSWTLILGAIFIFSVVADLAMPTFNTTLFALMGISAGTYLGFKFPEKQA